MEVITYNKRFDLPLPYLKKLFMPIVMGKNGRWYQVVIGTKGLPVARLVHHHLPDENEPAVQEKIFAEKEKGKPDKESRKQGKSLIAFT